MSIQETLIQMHHDSHLSKCNVYSLVLSGKYISSQCWVKIELKVISTGLKDFLFTELLAHSLFSHFSPYHPSPRWVVLVLLGLELPEEHLAHI